MRADLVLNVFTFNNNKNNNICLFWLFILQCLQKNKTVKY